MTTNEKLSLTIATVSLIIAVLTAIKSYLLSEYQLRLNVRNDFHKMLIEINKIQIADPDLSGVYDCNKSSLNLSSDFKTTAKIRSMAYMTLNTFEAVFAFYGDSPRLRKAEKESFEAWKGYFREFIQGSSLARQLMKDAEGEKTYHRSLITEFKSATEELQTVKTNLPVK